MVLLPRVCLDIIRKSRQVKDVWKHLFGVCIDCLINRNSQTQHDWSRSGKYIIIIQSQQVTVTIFVYTVPLCQYTKRYYLKLYNLILILIIQQSSPLPGYQY